MSETTSDASTNALEARFKSGATWFYWIAALSVINSIVILTGRDWAFIVGLGVTQIIDAIGLAAAESIGASGKVVAFLLDLVPVGVFALFGYFAGRRHGWAFLTGSILYACDGLIFLLVGDWLSLGFHAFALLGIYSGWKACREISASAEAAPAWNAAPQFPPELPTSTPPPLAPSRHREPVLAGTER
jgi:hypothetical protein